jgi:predicted aldo/keto reductase-like oxidoreductase
MKRRDFLFGVAGTGAIPKSSPLSPSEIETPLEPSRIKEYRTLGRTGFKASDLGAGHPLEETVMHALLMRGANYIDTSESYSNGGSERLIGRAIKGFDRKTLFINTKLVLTGNETSEQVKDRALRCLGRLDTEYIDCLMLSASVRTDVRNEAFHEATAQLTQEGKLRHVGVSCHGTNWSDEQVDPMDAVLGTAIEDGRFDVLLFVYNYLRRDMGERLLRECREKNIGTTVMKTSPFGHGGFDYFNDLYKERERLGEKAPEWMKSLRLKYERQREQARPFLDRHKLTTPDQIRDAAIRFVLNNPDVHSALVTFKNFDDIDNYLPLSGSRLTETDESSLSAFAETDGQLYCRHACGACESQCPSKVPVNTIMRYNHYFVAQGREKWALELYRDIENQKADVCEHCEGHCQAVCPFGVPIHDLLKFAHSNLTIA